MSTRVWGSDKSDLMKLKQLVAFLQEVPEFPDPDYTLEQYKTGADLAASILFSIESAYGDIGGRVVADLGCGTGILGIGAAALGAAHVTGFDIDPKAIACARENADDMGVLDTMGFVRANVVAMVGGGGPAEAGGAGADSSGGASAASPRTTTTPSSVGPVRLCALPAGDAGVDEEAEAAAAAEGDARGRAPAPLPSPPSGPVSLDGSRGGAAQTQTPLPPLTTPFRRHHAARHGPFDTVIMNPPFGTRRAGADAAFVRAALALTGPDGVVYSLHKSSTRAHFVRCAEAWGDDARTSTSAAAAAAAAAAGEDDASAGAGFSAGGPLGVELVAELRFAIPATYEFHREKSVDVAVDLLRFVKGKAGRDARSRHDSLPMFVGEEMGVGGGRSSSSGWGGGGKGRGGSRGRGGGRGRGR